MRKHLSILIILMLSYMAEGRTFYVSPAGSNSNQGTESAPWLTISKALATVTAGDTVYIREGTYKEYLTMKKSGTSSRRIVLAAYPGEHPVIDGSDKASNPDNP